MSAPDRKLLSCDVATQESSNKAPNKALSKTLSKTLSTKVSKTETTIKRTPIKNIDFKTLLISGVGFFADAYDLFVIDFVRSIIQATAFVEPTPFELSMVTGATLAGSVIGQLTFGFLGDYIGRRIMFVTTAALCICGNILSGVVGFGYTTGEQRFPIMYQLSLVRFFLGIGIGGEYPLAATVTSEHSDNDADQEPATGWLFFLKQKPNNVSAVFSMQGVGMLFSPLMIMVLVKGGMGLENIWRFCLGIGAVPSAVAFFYRYRMHESVKFKQSKRDLSICQSVGSSAFLSSDSNLELDSPEANASTDVDSPLSPASTASSSPKKAVTINLDKKASKKDTRIPMHKHEKEKSHFAKHTTNMWSSVKMFWKTLLGTTLTWFIIDVTFYGTASYKSVVIREIFGLNKSKSGESAAAKQRLLFAEDDKEVRRELQFPSSMMQNQRDRLRSLLLSSLESSTYARESAAPTNLTSADELNNNDGAQKRSLFAAPAAATLRFLQRGENEETRARLFKEAVMGTAVAGLACPGYILSTLFIHKIGLRTLTLWGFVAVSVVFGILGIYTFYNLKLYAIDLILFGLTFLFTNFGPNTTTFILPTVVFPSVIRSTCHGTSAAMGKIGAVVGTQMFQPILHACGLAWLQIICCAVAISGAVVTYFFVPKDNESIEAVKKHDAQLNRKATMRLQTLNPASSSRSASVTDETLLLLYQN